MEPAPKPPRTRTRPSAARAASPGSPHATIEEIIQSYEPMLAALASRHAPSWCSPGDLAQAGRIALWRAAPKYDPGKGSFEPYAVSAVRNAMMNEVRANPPVDQNAAPAGHADLVVPADADQDLVKAMRGLLSAEADVVERLYFRGQTQRQAADALALSQPRVSQTHRRALRRLRAVLAVRAA